MCGICGAVQIGGAPREVLDPGTLDRMTDLMSHRGPGRHGHLSSRRASRSASAGSASSMSRTGISRSRARIAASGRCRTASCTTTSRVRRDLEQQGHRFRSRCDTEILPHLYEQHGDALPRAASGHVRPRRLGRPRTGAPCIARDRLGIKPLYYAVAGDVLVFASELKSLLASGLVDGGLDYEAIDAYLTLGFFPTPATPLAGVSKLRPGQPPDRRARDGSDRELLALSRARPSRPSRRARTSWPSGSWRSSKSPSGFV